jgi:serine/threonine-protein kinase HipA
MVGVGGFLMDANGVWKLAPFYDFTYAEGPNGWHTLSIAGEGANPREEDLLRLSDSVDLSVKDAKEVIEIAKEVSPHWR